jgi:hypothetical protein
MTMAIWWWAVVMITKVTMRLGHASYYEADVVMVALL